MKRIANNHSAVGPIANREDFQVRSGNLSGQAHTPGRYAYRGYLPRGFADTLEDADFIVYSYSTPIAWHLPDGWVIPDHSYSNTTAKHQGTARQAARGDMSARHKRAGHELGLGPTGSRILKAIRCGYAVDLNASRRSTFQAVVDTGEAKWHADGDAIVPADDSHIRL